MPEEKQNSARRTHASTSRCGQRFEPPGIAELQAEFAGQYEILSLLGSGGMGAVYKARQTRLDRIVALKVLPREVRDDASFVARFEREARAMAKLKHPRIVALHDFGETPGGMLYIAMEFVQGRTLQDWVEARGLKPDQTLTIIAQICDALNFAHSQGIVHRDIKPQNIMLDVDRTVKVMDFGLARSTHDGVSMLTHADERLGTADYIAPEQLTDGTPVDHRADIYALGVLLYQMLTGSVPRGNFLAPSQRDDTVDPRLDDLVLKAMQPEPETRFQEVSELWTELEHIRTTTFTSASALPPGPMREAPPPTKRAVSPGVVVASIVTVVVMAIGVWRMNKPPQPASPATAATPVAAGVAAAAPARAPEPAVTLAPNPEPVVISKPLPSPAPVAATATVPEMRPAPATPPTEMRPAVAANEVDSRLADIAARFREALDRDVSKPHDTAVAKLNAQYAAALERTLTSGLQPGDAAAFRLEIDRTRAQQPPAGHEPASPALTSMRATYRESLAKLIRVRNEKAQPVWAGYDRLLADYQTELTRQGRIDDAIKVKTARSEALAARPAEVATAPASTPPPAPAAPVGPSVKPSAAPQAELSPVDWAFSVGATLEVERDGQVVTSPTPEQLAKGRHDITSISFPPTFGISDTDLQRLARWKKLRKFEARAAHRITDEGMRVFRNMEQLSELKLHGPGNGITDAGLAHLSDCKGLTWLVLDTTGITGGGFAKLRGCTYLQVINLTNAPVTGAGLEHIARFPMLVNLMLVNDTALRDGDLVKFKVPPALLLLDLTGCTGITEKGLAAVKGVSTLVPPTK